MEDVERAWEDILHDSMGYPVNALSLAESGAPHIHYDLELGSGLWGSHSRRADPLIALGSIGSLPSFEPFSSKSSESSPVLSDDYMYSPDELRRASRSTVSSEGTISPKDSIIFSPDINESVGYFPLSAAFNHTPSPYQATPGPVSPVSPHKTPRPLVPLEHTSKPDEQSEQSPAQNTRKRSTKVSPVSAAPTASKSSGLSNNNNSKPMTARDRKRRQMHNASAMRSRIRLNETLDKMWRTIPAPRRRRRLSSASDEACGDIMDDFDDDEEERIGRADKVEVGIDYIIHLEGRVKELEECLAHGSPNLVDEDSKLTANSHVSI